VSTTNRPPAQAGRSYPAAAYAHPVLAHPAQARYVLPSFVERTSYGIKEMNPYNKLFEERIIFLGVQIDDASANDVIAQLIALESMDPDRDITMYITRRAARSPR
jgi:ATP-dependent Clp protease protease subunit